MSYKFYYEDSHQTLLTVRSQTDINETMQELRNMHNLVQGSTGISDFLNLVNKAATIFSHIRGVYGSVAEVIAELSGGLADLTGEPKAQATSLLREGFSNFHPSSPSRIEFNSRYASMKIAMKVIVITNKETNKSVSIPCGKAYIYSATDSQGNTFYNN